MGKKKEGRTAGLWIEAEQERLSARAYALEDAFFAGIFSRSAWKARRQMRMRFFWETPLAYNYFRENLGRWMKKRLLGFLSWQQFIIRFAQSAVGKVDWTGHPLDTKKTGCGHPCGYPCGHRKSDFPNGKSLFLFRVFILLPENM